MTSNKKLKPFFHLGNISQQLQIVNLQMEMNEISEQMMQVKNNSFLDNARKNLYKIFADLDAVVSALMGAAYGAAKTAIATRGQARAKAPGTRLKMAPPTPFNTSITNQRAFAGVSLPLDEVKAIGKAHGASVNDMVLWLCSTALRGYLAEGRELPDKTLVAGVPISLRAEGDTSSNNQVSGTVIDLATQVKDPLQRLADIMAGTKAMNTLSANRCAWRSVGKATSVERILAQYTRITAKMAPVWMAMSNTLALASSNPSSDPARIRCPVEEMGKNSVNPSTTPMMAALTSNTTSTRTPCK